MKCIALVEARDHVCFRYRLQPFLPALEDAGWKTDVWSIERGYRKTLEQLRNLPESDCVFVQRLLLSPWQLRTLRCSTRRVIFDFDDAIYLRDSDRRRGAPHFLRRFCFRHLVRRADLVIAGNGFLAERVRRGFPKSPPIVIPTCVDPSKYKTTKHGTRSGKTLVWIGSASTAKLLEGSRSLFEDLAGRVPGLRLKTISDAFPVMGAMPVEPVPWSESSEAAELSSADLGVHWLDDNEWNRGKCGLKILQYMAAGLPVVTNPTGVHSEMVLHGSTGYLAETPQQWFDAIAKLGSSPELRNRFGAAGRKRVVEHYSVAAWKDTFATCFVDSRSCANRSS